ncbi:Zinc D-Ala-D-Ala carboxypeptidase precursor [Bacteroidales bacterium Barb6]|nr:Zinc D-Ala-D-Ala carboxypeptidase precursor [Bacteroidales bacterium Barb6]
MTPNFPLAELLRSPTAQFHSVSNLPGMDELNALMDLAVYLLQPLRNAAGCPVTVTSGYRSPQLNKIVNGAKNSQHMKGQAADCTAPCGADRLLDILQSLNIPFDQAILYRKRNFLHLSYNPSNNRRQIIIKK